MGKSISVGRNKLIRTKVRVTKLPVPNKPTVSVDTSSSQNDVDTSSQHFIVTKLRIVPADRKCCTLSSERLPS